MREGREKGSEINRRRFLAGTAALGAMGAHGADAARTASDQDIVGGVVEGASDIMSIDKRAAAHIAGLGGTYQYDLKAGWVRAYDRVIQGFAYANEFDEKLDSYITISLTHDQKIMIRTLKKSGANDIAVIRVERNGRVRVEQFHYVAPPRRGERK